MIDVTIANFETEVVAASMTTPVLLDFWAPWCGPCKSLGPILEKVELEYAGRFKLVKVDSDQEQQLASAFGIRSIPTCILMINGQPVDGFTGALPEGKIKEFLDKHLPPAEEAPAEDEPAADEAADPDAVLAKLQASVAADPDNDASRFELVKLLLQGGQLAEATSTFAPAAGKVGVDRKFAALQLWFDAIAAASGIDAASAKAAHEQAIVANRRDFEARYAYAQSLIAAQNWTAAMDELLEILMRDKAWSDGLARKAFVAVLDVIEQPKPKVADGQIPPDDPVVASYRRRLSSVILS